MKTLKILVILCSFLLTLCADDDHEYERNHIYKNLDYLNLNKNQLKKMKTILISYKLNYQEFYEYKEKQNKKLQNIMKNEIFDKQLYIQTIQKINQEAIKLEAEKLEQIHKILNKKQRIKFLYYLQEWEVE